MQPHDTRILISSKAFIGQFVEWTFQTVLLPISDMFNWGVIALGLAGLAFWLRLQSKYNARAEQDGTIM